MILTEEAKKNCNVTLGSRECLKPQLHTLLNVSYLGLPSIIVVTARKEHEVYTSSKETFLSLCGNHIA